MKLKDNITKEMLESVGFEFYEEDIKVGLFHCVREEENGQEIYILLNKEYWEHNRQITWNDRFFEGDITPYVQDLINLGWIEGEKMKIEYKEIKRNIFEIALEDLEIIEGELLSASDNAYEMQIGCVDVLGDNFLRIQNALNIAKKEHKLLAKYRFLLENVNEWDLDFETVNSLLIEIDAIEYFLEEMTKDTI